MKPLANVEGLKEYYGKLVEEQRKSYEIPATPHPVHHPTHYTFGRFEVWDVILDWNLGYCLGNVIKYVARAGKKTKETELEDLEKALAYLKKHIDHIKSL